MDQVDPPAVGRLHPEPPMTHNDDDLSSKAIEAMNAGDWKRACTLWVLKVDKLYRLRAAGEIAPPAPLWQPMETMPENGQVIVCWDERPSYDTIGRAEYLEIIGYGEAPALGWMPLPPAPPQAPEPEP